MTVAILFYVHIHKNYSLNNQVYDFIYRKALIMGMSRKKFMCYVYECF